MRKIQVGPLAPRAAWKYGQDYDGTRSYNQHLILPVRDTPGVFRHLVLGFSSTAPWRLNIASGTFDRIYNYRLDARHRPEIPDREDQTPGNSPYAYYSPDPDRLLDPYAVPDPSDAPERAVAWYGGDSAYAINPGDREPLATISRMVGIPHGNGRDWWVIAFGGQSSPRAVAVFLLDNRGLQLHSVNPEAIPFRPHENHYWHQGMQPAVSQQGDKIALHAMQLYNSRVTYFAYQEGLTTPEEAGIALWDFDRCSGTVTNSRHIKVQYKPQTVYPPSLPGFSPARGAGCAFSPSGKYLYYTEETYLARFDVTGDNILASEQIVKAPDTLLSDVYNHDELYRKTFHTLHTTFGPDGVMLGGGGGSAPNSDMFWNLDAENPEDVGGGLSVLKAPCLNSNRYITPYYEIYDLDGSACDTLGVDGWSYGCSSTWQQLTPDTAVLAPGETFEWRGSTYSQAGSYNYKRRSPAGCDSTWRLEVLMTSGIQRLADRSSFQIYPNPGSNGTELTILWERAPEAGVLTILDPTGRQLLTVDVNQDGGIKKTMRIPVDLGPGIYTVRYYTTERVDVGQLMVIE